MSATGQLDGVRAVVTGSTRGLGEAIARDLVARGARVVLNGTDTTRCADLGAELAMPAVAGSVADEETADRLIATCVEEFGGVDLVVNNAGITRDGMLAKAQAADFDAVIAVHLRGTWLMCRSAARAMRASGGGTIVNVVSGTALYGNLGQSAYAAAKGGILGLTRALALELKRGGICVNAVAPVARTEMVEPLLAAAADLEPLFGAPAEVAPFVSFLASPAARELTGAVLGFDGRELSAWTHPAHDRSTRQEVPWTFDNFAQSLSSAPLPHTNPDRLGRAVHAFLGVT